MKGLGVAQLMTFPTLKRQGFPLARDLVFFAQADEKPAANTACGSSSGAP
jgi:hypothetical protein